MAEEEQQITMRLTCDFYRDGFHQAVAALVLILIGIVCMLSVSIGLMISKPKPIMFVTDNDWRVVAPVPVTVSAYPPVPDLLQWVAQVLPLAFNVDFVNYQRELNAAENYFTPDGWKNFLQQANPYISQAVIITSQVFLTSNPAGAPIIIQEGPYQDTYGWWIQMPINLSYSGAEKGATIPLSLQVLVVRVPTLNDLNGIRINKIVINKGAGDQVIANE